LLKRNLIVILFCWLALSLQPWPAWSLQPAGSQPAKSPPPAAAPVTAPAVAPVTSQATPQHVYDPTLLSVDKVPLNIASREMRTLLWQVRAKTGENTAYLFGTIHVGKTSFYPLPEHVDAALRSADRLVVEANINDNSNATEIATLMDLPKGETIEKHISPANLARLKAQLQQQKIPYAGIAGMRPVMLGGLLPIVEFVRLGYDMNQGLDLRLIERANAEFIPVLELESALGQIKLLTGMSAELQEAFLENALLGLEQGKTAAQVTGFVNAWQMGDADMLHRLAEQAAKGGRKSAEINDIVLNSRHPAMLNKIEGYLASGKRHFVAVGSLHLVGPQGLVSLLKARGYQVTQVFGAIKTP
jgi:uncharacterized protein